MSSIVSPTPTPRAAADSGASVDLVGALEQPTVRAPRSGAVVPPDRGTNTGMSTAPDSTTPCLVSFTATTSGSAAMTAKASSAGTKSSPLNPKKLSSSEICPKRSGWAAASLTPAANVSAATTPSTPTTAPTSAGYTGTAWAPRPRSSAKLVPTETGTGAPARAVSAGDPRAPAAAVDGQGAGRRPRGEHRTGCHEERDEDEPDDEDRQVRVAARRGLDGRGRARGELGGGQHGGADRRALRRRTAARVGGTAAAMRT